MGSVRILFGVAFLATGCTQVHELGQVDDGGNGASSSTTNSTSTSSDSGVDSSSETSGDGDGSSEESDGQESDTDGPIPAMCEIVDLGGEDGLTLDIVAQAEPWPTGVCHDLHLTNETPDDVIWTRDLRFGGMLNNHWNAELEELNPTDWRFGGKASANNIVVLSGQTVVFGSCMACMP